MRRRGFLAALFGAPVVALAKPEVKLPVIPEPELKAAEELVQRERDVLHDDYFTICSLYTLNDFELKRDMEWYSGK